MSLRMNANKKSTGILAGKAGAELFGDARLEVAGCLLLRCTAGQASLTISSSEFILSEGVLAMLVFDMMILPRRVSRDFKCDFCEINMRGAGKLFFPFSDNGFWDFIYKTPVFEAEGAYSGLFHGWFDMLLRFQVLSEHSREKILYNEVSNFLMMLGDYIYSRSDSDASPSIKNRGWSIILGFIRLLHRHYAEQHTVKWYADRLHVSADYLNRLCKIHIGESAKAHIDAQIIAVVKSLLLTTDLSVKTISDELHFVDSSYLCRVFRRVTGMTPLEFRHR